ncbi:MAG: type II toxin-antitoxin system HicA family toxin [Halobacteriales archaeon]|nr:type II toxin-antitoxin system HicA family toxin [Halobacteriales archaeon]
MSYREVQRFLHAHGFHELRQAGSHVTFRHLDGRKTVVPRHRHDVAPKLVAKILKDAGIDPNSVRR